MQQLHTLKTAWYARRPLYGWSWDMSKASDSVPSHQRGSLEIAPWLIDLDEHGYTIVWKPVLLVQSDANGLAALRPHHGTFRALLLGGGIRFSIFTILDSQQNPAGQFQLRRPSSSTHAVLFNSNNCHAQALGI